MNLGEPTRPEAKQVVEQIKKFVTDNPQAAQAANLLMLGFRLIHFSRLEMSTVKRADESIIDAIIAIHHSKAMEPFDMADLKRDIEKILVPYVNAKVEKEKAENFAVRSERRRLVLKFPHGFPIAYDGQLQNILIRDHGVVFGDKDWIKAENAKTAAAVVLSALPTLYFGAEHPVEEVKALEDHKPTQIRVLEAAWYQGAGVTYANLLMIADDWLGGIKNVRMVIVDDLEILMPADGKNGSRLARLTKAFIVLKQLQLQNRFAMVVGVPTNNDLTKDLSVRTLYPGPLTEGRYITDGVD
jgi:hypothetical protein